MTKDEKIANYNECLLSILDSLKLCDYGSLIMDDETLSEVMFRKMKGYGIDLNKELGFVHLKPVPKIVPKTGLLTEPMEDMAIAEMKAIIKTEKRFLRFATNKMAAYSLSGSHILDERSYTLGIMDGKNYKELGTHSNIAYKWRKIFAATNHNKGKIVLSPEEAQELIDDIENSNK